MKRRLLCALAAFSTNAPAEPEAIPELPTSAKLVLEERWSSGKIAPERWYALRKKWGQNNSGVVPENLSIVTDTVRGKSKNVLRCTAHGDRYDGPITGQWKKKTRVGGVLVTKQQFASGRYQVVMKIGTPENPRPAGMVPAIWTYGYRMVKLDTETPDKFDAKQPLYHPFLQQWGAGRAFYWSEIDFPEFGKAGDYSKPMYNTFLNKQHHSTTFDAHGAADGTYHTYTTEWRTGLVPIPAVKDSQVAGAEGFYWVQDKQVPYKNYWGSPLKKLGKNRYAVCTGLSAKHWIDGKFVGENTKLVPAMSGQLNLGVWLPKWAGAADWKSAAISIASVKVWQFGDPGDVKGILTEDITSNFDAAGNPIKQ